MAEFPLYYEAKEKIKTTYIELTDEQQRQRDQDREVIKAMDDYYSPYREQWRRNGGLFNLIQTGSDDVVSNWYLGWARLLINHSMAMLTAGSPKGDFEPVGNQDAKMQILVNALVEHTLNKSNWTAHQRLWIQDLHVFGNGVTKSYSELPMRKRRYEQKDGSVEDKIVRDFRRSKVGIRRKSPFKCMRSIHITDPDDVPVSTEEETTTWDSFAIRYGNAILPDGTKKYDTEQIPVGSHVRIITFYDEYGDAVRVYVCSYGNTPESHNAYESSPPSEELGYPIYNKPLSRYKITEAGHHLVGGANIPGMSPLAFATFDDQLDEGFETYSVCGMGVPQIIEGPEAVMQGLVNMSIDNERLLNTVPVSYEPNNTNSPSGLDLDVRNMYSGLIIDGKITPQPLGTSTAGSNQVLWEWLKFLIYQLTGINPELLTGDKLNTAYQSGLLLRQMNLRSQSRINQWENGALKRAWTVHGANALSEVTVQEWEDITEDEAKRIQESIMKDEATAEDYNEEEIDGEKVYQKRRLTVFPVQGYKFKEDFTGKNKKRTLDPDSTDNTLIEDRKMSGNKSYVPAHSRYLLPSGSIESVMEFQVRVDGSSMIRDLKTQDVEMGKNALLTAQSIAQFDPEFAKKVDWSKLYVRLMEPTGLTEDDVFKTETDTNPLQKQYSEAAENLEESISQLPNEIPQQPTEQLQASPAGQILEEANPEPRGTNPALEALAQGG